MEEQLLGFISKLKSNKNIQSFDEAATKQAIVLRCLSLLGWDVFNIEEVYPEYSVGPDTVAKRVDYSLRISGANKVFVEVKKPSEELEKHQEQLSDYFSHEGVKLAILTNGITWWFYLPLNEGIWEQRKFYSIDISQQEAGDITSRFVEFLARANIANGIAFDNAETVYKSKQKQKILQATIPKAWNTIISEPDELLVDLINETAESICGYRAGNDIIKQFLYTYREQLSISADISIPPIPITPQRPPKTRKRRPSSKEPRKDSLLRLFSDIGGEGTRREINERIPDYWELRPEELEIENGTQKPLYWHHVVSACQGLKDRYGYLENPKRGTWRLTDKGRAFLVSKGMVSKNVDISPKPQNSSPEVEPIHADFKDKKISSFYFRGTRYEVDSWRGLLLELSKLMNAAHRSDFDKVLGLKGAKRSYFSRNEDLLTTARKIPETGIFVEQNLSARNITRVCRRLIALFGYSEEELKIELNPV